MNESTRRKRVVVGDAENPLVEVSGDFYWLEDHQRIVSQGRESASPRATRTGSQLPPNGDRPPWWSCTGAAWSAACSSRCALAFVVLAYAIRLISGLVGSVHSP
jgi:hypothetical protein